MFFFKPKPVLIEKNNIIIHTNRIKKNKSFDFFDVLELNGSNYLLNFFEDDKKVMSYNIETLDSNPNLDNQYFHISVRIQANLGIISDGIISSSKYKVPDLLNEDSEGIRFQPFFLSISDSNNETFYGKGLFERGLHFSGYVTPSTVRLCCVCDSCKKPFTIQSYHAGNSESQYFYSSDSSETLFVSYYELENMPYQLQNTAINLEKLKEVESLLPKPKNSSGEFKYYNSFRCPHCNYAYIDFEKYPEIRPYEYYGNYYINKKIEVFTKQV